MPSPETETLYLKSVNNTFDQDGIYLRDLKADKLSLANTDFDKREGRRFEKWPPSAVPFARFPIPESERTCVGDVGHRQA